MIIPIRCFTCGKLIADKWTEYETKVNKLKEENPDINSLDSDNECIKEIFDELELNRYCCKRMFLSHVDLIHIISNNKHNEYNYDNVK